MSKAIISAYKALTERLDTAPIITLVDNATISIVNEAFNWMQTDCIKDVCNTCGLSMVITFTSKRPHDAVEITLIESPLTGEKYKSLKASNGLIF